MSERIRSKFLVHWTGRDIDAGDTGTIHSRYYDRFLKTLQTGLWLTPCREILYGGGATYEYTVPMTCFTEIRLSAVLAHSKNYGRLGFGFHREFVLSSGGSPVLYVRPDERNLILQRVAGVISRLEALEGFLTLGGSGPESFRFSRDANEGRDLMQQLCAFIKMMSPPGKEDYEFLEEAEWRIAYHEIWSHNLELPSAPEFIPNAARALREVWTRPKALQPSGVERPPFYVKFTPDDLKLIIFPDEEVRDAVYNSAAFNEWIESRNGPIPLLTLDECGNF